MGCYVAKTVFVAGTDTDVGKTFISVALLRALQAAGKTTLAMKPVAAGTNANGQNDDALALMQAMSAQLSYPQVNPVVFAPPIAPHIAAAQAGKRISAERLVGFARGLAMMPHDIMLIEGAGGWLCPINNKETMADMAQRLTAPVILVVGMRLGCLNHALLSAQAIRAAGLPLAAWVANCVDPDMLHLDENIDALRQRLPAPCLGVVPHCEADNAAAYLDITPLLAIQ